VFSKTCAIDAAPEARFIHPVNKDEIIDWICQKLGMESESVIIPVEHNFFIKLNIVDGFSFADSLFDYIKTSDMELYSIDPSFVIGIHDGEYEVDCFYCPV
jgi:hypothetical protein